MQQARVGCPQSIQFSGTNIDSQYKLCVLLMYRQLFDHQGDSLNDIYTEEQEEKLCEMLLEEGTRSAATLRLDSIVLYYDAS